MFQSEQLQEKWAPLLNYEGLDSIKDSHRRAVTAVLLENQERFLREQSSFDNGSLSMLMESPTNSGNAAGASGAFGASAAAGGPTAGFDPVSDFTSLDVQCLIWLLTTLLAYNQ
jgi:hypothetical protein